MMIHNHTSDDVRYIIKSCKSNVEFPYVLEELMFDKINILWNKRFLLLWSGESTRYEYRECQTNIKVKLFFKAVFGLPIVVFFTCFRCVRFWSGDDVDSSEGRRWHTLTY